MVDLTKLTPAPWESANCAIYGPFSPTGRDRIGVVCEAVPKEESKARTNAAFIALARNAFDVMMRRGWWPIKRGDKWQVGGQDPDEPSETWETTPIQTGWPDPFTALVEADAWYKANVEKTGG